LAGGFRHLSAGIGLGKEQPPPQDPGQRSNGVKKGPLDVQKRAKNTATGLPLWSPAMWY
jgi:hypothetical protein